MATNMMHPNIPAKPPKKEFRHWATHGPWVYLLYLFLIGANVLVIFTTDGPHLLQAGVIGFNVGLMFAELFKRQSRQFDKMAEEMREDLHQMELDFAVQQAIKETDKRVRAEFNWK